MRKTTLFILTLLISFMVFDAEAKTGDYIIEIEAGKKIMNTNKLDLSPTTRLSELLEIFPELLAREGELKLQNYDLQIEDVSTGDSKLIVLDQLRLSDIKDIEVSATPSASQQKNGQGGVIKIHLNPLNEGLSGEAILGAGSSISVNPGFKLNYKKGAWSVRGNVMLNYYHPRNENTARQYGYDGLSKYQSDSLTIDNSYEMVSIDAFYTPNIHNKLHIWGWENMSFISKLGSSSVEINSKLTNVSSSEKNKDFKWLAGAKYNHLFNKSEIEAECTYYNGPGSTALNKYDLLRVAPSLNTKYSDATTDSKLTGALKYKYNFVPDSPKSKAKLTGGINVNLVDNGIDYDYQRLLSNYMLQGRGKMFYFSPFIETDNIFGKWFLKGSFRYQHYATDINANDDTTYKRLEDFFTGFLSAGYQIAPHHHLSLILDRSLQRGAVHQYYPYKIFDPDKERFSVGDAGLRPVFTNSIAANYITDFASGDNKFTFDLELKYLYNTDIISSHYIENNVIQYTNDGTSHIGAANFLFNYSNKVFAVSLTANAFNNYTHIAGIDDHYVYYNLSVVPSLSFTGGWVISAQMAYNSHAYSKTSRLGDYFYANTRFSKLWKNWIFYLELDDNFHKMVVDEFISDTVIEWYLHNLHKPSLSAGVHFKF